jgi:hypothetical protein
MPKHLIRSGGNLCASVPAMVMYGDTLDVASAYPLCTQSFEVVIVAAIVQGRTGLFGTSRTSAPD